MCYLAAAAGLLHACSLRFKVDTPEQEISWLQPRRVTESSKYLMSQRKQVWSQNGNYLGQHVGHTDAVACLTLDANFLFSGALCSLSKWDTDLRVCSPGTCIRS